MFNQKISIGVTKNELMEKKSNNTMNPRKINHNGKQGGFKIKTISLCHL